MHHALCYPHTRMPGFNGLRVLSFESRRAKEIAQLISNNGGVPIVAPSTREVPIETGDDVKEFIRSVLAHSFDVIIFMTGVGARALVKAAESVCPPKQFLSALGQSQIVVRGPKPAAVMRELNVPVTLTVPEPNTWREIVQALDQNKALIPLDGRRIAVQEHGEPSHELYEALRQRGANVFAVHVYRWELPEDTRPLQSAIRSLTENQVDVAIFTSQVQFVHAAEIARQMGVEHDFPNALNRVVVASIGPVTSDALRKNGVQIDIEPSHPKMGFLVKETAEKSAELLRKKTRN